MYFLKPSIAVHVVEITESYVHTFFGSRSPLKFIKYYLTLGQIVEWKLTYINSFYIDDVC